MNIILFLLALLLLLLLSLKLITYLKTSRKNHSFLENKSWMSMSKSDRIIFDNKERINSMKRKKLLLSKIRKEYKNIKNGNN